MTAAKSLSIQVQFGGRVERDFAEFDGDKKVSSLPYTFTVNADERRVRPNSQVRNGVRVPVSTGKDQYTYLDVGTNIDCSALQQDDGSTQQY